MLCKVCGTSIEPGTNFCAICGTPVMYDSYTPSEPVQPQFIGAVPPNAETGYTVAVPDGYYSPVYPTDPGSFSAPAGKGKSKAKKILTVILSVFLILAIGAGSVSIALFTNPTTAIPLAAKNTLFNSSEIDIAITITNKEGRKANLNLYALFGNDIESSIFEYSLGSKHNSNANVKIKLEDGKLCIKGVNGKKVESELDDILENFEDKINENDYLEEEIDLEEELNELIDNKLNQKALEKVFDNIIAPALENYLEEEKDIEIEIPDFDELIDKLFDITKSAMKGNCRYEKIDSDLPGTTYEIVYDDYPEFVRSFWEALLEDEFFYDLIIQSNEDFDKDEKIDQAVESAEEAVENDKIADTTVTLKSNRITNITIETSDLTYEIEINSKR